MHVYNIRQRKLRLHMLRFSAVRTKCHDTSQRLIWQTESKRCCLYLHFTVTTSYCSAGTDGHHALQSFSICKSTINLLYNIDVMDFVNTQPTNNDLLHELLAVQNKTGRPPHAQSSPVAASPTDLGRGKHTHTSVRPTCYTSKPKNNSNCL